MPEKVIPIAPVFPASLLRPVSPLDVWERDVFAGGARGNPRYVDPEVGHVAAAEAAAHQAHLDHAALVAERVRNYLGAGMPMAGDTAAARLGSAQIWLETTEQRCVGAQRNAEETAGAAVRVAEAEKTVREIEAAVRIQYDTWVKFPGDSTRPPTRSDEVATLRSIIDTETPAARVADDAQVAMEVAQSEVEHLQILVDWCHRAAVRAAAMVEIRQRYQDGAALILSAFAELRALGAATAVERSAYDFDAVNALINAWPDHDKSPHVGGGTTQGARVPATGNAGKQPMKEAPDPVNRGVDD